VGIPLSLHSQYAVSVCRNIFPKFLIIYSTAICIRWLRESRLRIQTRGLHITCSLITTFVCTTIDLRDLADRCLLYIETRLTSSSIRKKAAIPGLFVCWGICGRCTFHNLLLRIFLKCFFDSFTHIICSYRLIDLFLIIGNRALTSSLQSKVRSFPIILGRRNEVWICSRWSEVVLLLIVLLMLQYKQIGWDSSLLLLCCHILPFNHLFYELYIILVDFRSPVHHSCSAHWSCHLRWNQRREW